MRPMLVGLAAVIFTAWSGPAVAGPWNHVHVYPPNNTVGCCWHVQEGPGPVYSAGDQLAHEVGWYSFKAGAAAGNVQTWTQSEAQGRSSLNYNRLVFGSSTIDDLIFTDGTGVPKPVTFYVHVDAFGSALVEFNTSHTSGRFRSELKVVSNQGYGAHFNWFDDNSGTYSEYTGWLTGETGSSFSGTYRVGPFSAMSEEPVTVFLSVGMYANPSVSPGGTEPVLVTGNVSLNFALAEAAIESPGFDANSEQAGIVDNFYQQLVAVDGSGERASGLALSQSIPNPTREGAIIGFRISRSGTADLSLYDVAGRRVKRLASGWFEAGEHEVRWRGDDAEGRRLRPGIYFYRLRHGGQETTRSLVLLRP